MVVVIARIFSRGRSGDGRGRPSRLSASSRTVAPRWLLAIVFVCCCCSRGPAADNIAAQEGYEAIAARVSGLIREQIEQKSIPAFSIALIDGQRIVWAEGFGFQDRKRTQQATARTVYRVGSISKLFTDIAVLQLVEQGKIKLDSPVQEYLPEFHPQNPYPKKITLRQLMAHRAGLVRESPVGNYFDPQEPSLRATVESLNSSRLVYEPEARTK